MLNKLVINSTSIGFIALPIILIGGMITGLIYALNYGKAETAAPYITATLKDDPVTITITDKWICIEGYRLELTAPLDLTPTIPSESCAIVLQPTKKPIDIKIIDNRGITPTATPEIIKVK